MKKLKSLFFTIPNSKNSRKFKSKQTYVRKENKEKWIETLVYIYIPWERGVWTPLWDSHFDPPIFSLDQGILGGQNDPFWVPYELAMPIALRVQQTT